MVFINILNYYNYYNLKFDNSIKLSLFFMYLIEFFLFFKKYIKIIAIIHINNMLYTNFIFNGEFIIP